MNQKELARKFAAMTESRNWSRRSLVSWLGKGCVLALAGRGLTACSDPVDVGGDVEWTGCDDEGFAFEPGNCDVISWFERTVDTQRLEDILAGWQLSVGGMVESEYALSFDQLVDLPSHDPVVDFHCVEGWSVYDVPWNGVKISSLLDRANVDATATHVNFYTLGSEYNESLTLDVARESNTILAYGVGGSSLSLKHGFPARLVIPRLYGYKNAKYVERIELSDHPIEGYWVDLGYSYEGTVQPDRLREGKY